MKFMVSSIPVYGLCKNWHFLWPLEGQKVQQSTGSEIIISNPKIFTGDHDFISYLSPLQHLHFV